MADILEGKIVSFARSRGIKIDADVQKVLSYFCKNYLTYFLPGGCGPAPDLDLILSEKTGLDLSAVRSITSTLIRAGILREEKGVHSIGGAEYWFGIPDWLRNELAKDEQQVPRAPEGRRDNETQ